MVDFDKTQSVLVKTKIPISVHLYLEVPNPYDVMGTMGIEIARALAVTYSFKIMIKSNSRNI